MPSISLDDLSLVIFSKNKTPIVIQSTRTRLACPTASESQRRAVTAEDSRAGFWLLHGQLEQYLRDSAGDHAPAQPDDIDAYAQALSEVAQRLTGYAQWLRAGGGDGAGGQTP